MKHIIRCAAGLLSLCLLLPAAGCFKVKIDLPSVPHAEAPETAPAQTEGALPFLTAAPETAAPIPTAAPEAPTDQTASPSSAAEAASAAPAAKTPDAMREEELLAFFNDSLNRIKRGKVGFKKSKLTKILDLQLSNSAANTLVGFVKGALLSETADETTVAKGEDGSAVFSPSDKPYVCAWTMVDLTSLSCRRVGEAYEIAAAVKSETNPAPENSAMGRGFDFMTVEDVVNIYAPKVGATVARENIEVVFSDCTAKLTVTADGQVLGYETYVKGVMHMNDASIKKVITIDTDLAITLGSTTTYSDFVY